MLSVSVKPGRFSPPKGWEGGAKQAKLEGFQMLPLSGIRQHFVHCPGALAQGRSRKSRRTHGCPWQRRTCTAAADPSGKGRHAGNG